MSFEPPTSLVIIVRHVSKFLKKKRIKTWPPCEEQEDGKEHSVASCREGSLCLCWGNGSMRAYTQPLDFCLLR